MIFFSVPAIALISTLYFTVAASPPPQLIDGWKYTNAAGWDKNAQVHYNDEYFDVLSEAMPSVYGEVFWPMSVNPSPLPTDIIARYENAVMSITGYESSVVEYVNGVETPVPCSDLYNHHYVTFMIGKDAPSVVHMDMAGHARSKPESSGQPVIPVHVAVDGQKIPSVHLMAENNGNEHRGCFRGWPAGYGQLVYSPTHMLIGPMSINTRSPTGRPAGGPAPRECPDPDQKLPYSALHECPCTDRIVIDPTAGTIDGVNISFDCQELAGIGINNNTACSVATYRGGLRCCNHKTILLDKDQVFNTTSTFYHKFRVYHQQYRVNSTRNLLRLQHQLGASEYDIPANGTYTLSMEFPASHIFLGGLYASPSDLDASGQFELISASAHLHVGGLSMELINVDTNETLCRTGPIVGTTPGKFMDEDGYVVGIPTCIWGHDGTTPLPPKLTLNTTLRHVSIYNATIELNGVMSHFQMQGAAGWP